MSFIHISLKVCDRVPCCIQHWPLVFLLRHFEREILLPCGIICNPLVFKEIKHSRLSSVEMTEVTSQTGIQGKPAQLVKTASPPLLWLEERALTWDDPGMLLSQAHLTFLAIPSLKGS